MHAPSPMDPTRRKFAVSESGGLQLLKAHLGRVEAERSHAILSSCASSANRGCGVPWPRLGPHGGLFVKTRAPSKR